DLKWVGELTKFMNIDRSALGDGAAQSYVPPVQQPAAGTGAPQEDEDEEEYEFEEPDEFAYGEGDFE
ncbi:MAG: hypothetical protein J6O71_01075, partial [Lachnospiraceae bacterium]|nr:hypothetical protein [Lachnospiraceae bacterium]